MQFVAVQLTEPLQKLWMMYWLSFWEGSGDIVDVIVAHQGLQYLSYGFLLLHSPWIGQHTTLKIVDET